MIGQFDIPQAEYRAIDALSNGEAQMFAKNPSAYIWNKTAPLDSSKANTADTGTALHALLLEPETYDDLIKVASVKGRDTQAFKKEQAEYPDCIVMTEKEEEQVRIMAQSAKCDPMFNALLNADGECETSIVVWDEERGIYLKIRPDKVAVIGESFLLTDAKTTATLDDWRTDKPWLNPLFKHGYGHTAAFYLHAASIHYGVELTEYAFAVVQKSASLGRYPVSVFTISKDELIEMGFWGAMQANLDHFADRLKSNNFMTAERFPLIK
jgi:exodeoxyribonuclease VIII